MSTNTPSITVAHSMFSLNSGGGIARWLLKMAQFGCNSDAGIHHIVIPRYTVENSLENQLLAMGVEVIYPPTSDLRTYMGLCREVYLNSKVDVVHSHFHTLSLLIHAQAVRTGVRRRIAHSRSTRVLGNRQRFLMGVPSKLLNLIATDCIAVSKMAGTDLFGPSFLQRYPQNIFPPGFDVDGSTDSYRRDEIFPELQNRFLVGHVGRFAPEKNHSFLIEIAKICRKAIPGIHFVLIGDGKLHAQIKACIEKDGLENHFTLMGYRSDVLRILPALDAFCLPSIYEGFGQALLQAQCVGLPCLATETLPEECFGEHCTALPLNDAHLWVDALARIASSRRELQPDRDLLARYSLPRLANRLTQFYRSQLS